MKSPPASRWVSLTVLGVLGVLALLVLGIRGSEPAMAAALAGVLLIAYSVRHGARAQLRYARQEGAADARRLESAEHRPQPFAASTECAAPGATNEPALSGTQADEQ